MSCTGSKLPHAAGTGNRDTGTENGEPGTEAARSKQLAASVPGSLFPVPDQFCQFIFVNAMRCSFVCSSYVMLYAVG